jgi:hypothetical protein
MPHGADGGDRAAALRSAIHDRGIKLVASSGVEDGAFSGVEEWIILKETDNLLDSVEARAVLFQDTDADVEGFGKRCFDGSRLVGWRFSRTAVQGDGETRFGL